MIGIPNEPNRIQQLDNVAAEIRLPPEHAMPSCAGKRMVIILQTLTHRDQGNQIVVGAVIVQVKATRSEIMAHGSNAPARLVDDEAANQSAPQEAEKRSVPSAGD